MKLPSDNGRRRCHASAALRNPCESLRNLLLTLPYAPREPCRLCWNVGRRMLRIVVMNASCHWRAGHAGEVRHE